MRYSYDDPGGRYDARLGRHDGSYDPSNPQSFNRYAYVLNNPLSYTDPTGLDCEANPQNGVYTCTAPGQSCDTNANQHGCGAPPPGCSFIFNAQGTFEGQECFSTPSAGGTSNPGNQGSSGSGGTSTTSVQVSSNPPSPCQAGTLDSDVNTAKIFGVIANLFGLVGQAAKVGFVYETEKTGGAWDFKNQPFAGAHPELDDFGNFHYGAIGRAVGLPDTFMSWAAGYASSNHYKAKGKPDPYGSPSSGPPYGDNPENQYWIHQGQVHGHC